MTVKVDHFLCVSLPKAKATIKLSLKQEEIYDFQLKPFWKACLVVPAVAVCADWGLEGLPPPSCTVSATQNLNPGQQGQESAGWGTGRRESGTLDIQGFIVCFVSIWTILPAELEDSFQNDPWAIASLGHFIWKRKELF